MFVHRAKLLLQLIVMCIMCRVDALILIWGLFVQIVCCSEMRCNVCVWAPHYIIFRKLNRLNSYYYLVGQTDNHPYYLVAKIVIAKQNHEWGWLGCSGNRSGGNNARLFPKLTEQSSQHMRSHHRNTASTKQTKTPQSRSENTRKTQEWIRSGSRGGRRGARTTFKLSKAGGIEPAAVQTSEP